jgi:hypothetical protein
MRITKKGYANLAIGLIGTHRRGQRLIIYPSGFLYLWFGSRFSFWGCVG